MPVAVRGLRELNRALRRADTRTRAEFRTGFRKLAEPVRVDAEKLALSDITRITVPWSRMRTGVTQKLVYVAPRQRGIKGRGDDPRRRPKFADLMMNRALSPALERNKGKIEHELERTLDRIADEFETGV